MRCILTFDVGGTSLKGALIGPRGETEALDSLSQSPPVADFRGWSEKDPQQWWEDLLRVGALVLSRPQSSRLEIAAIVITGVTRTQVFLDKNGEPIRPAITWADGRAASQANRIIAARQELGQAAKSFGPLNTYHTLARLLWLQEEEPRSFERLHMVLEPKDYLNFRLTGKLAADTISLSRLTTIRDQKLAVELFRRLRLRPEIVPSIHEPQHHLGAVLSGLPTPFDRLAGVPVFVGSMDAWCSCLGLGALRANRAYNISGTSEVMGVVSDSYQEIPGLITLPWSQGLYQVGGPSQTGADCLRWYLQTFEGGTEAEDVGTILEKLQHSARQPEPILFLPYLHGERTPLWEPHARGLFFGIHRCHGKADFLWAILEGIALANRQILELATGSQLEEIQEVRIGGGAARSDLWCQLRADVWKRAVVRTTTTQAALLGAAMVGYYGLGDYGSLAEAQSAMVCIDKTFEPGGSRWGQSSEVYDLLYERFVEIQAAVLPLMRSFSKAAQHSLRFCT